MTSVGSNGDGKRVTGNQYHSNFVIEQPQDLFQDEPLLVSNSAFLYDNPNQPILLRFWNSLVFSWFNPVLESIQSSLDEKRSPDLTEDAGIPPLPPQEATRDVALAFEKLWEEEKKRVNEKLEEEESDDDPSSTGAAEPPGLAMCLAKSHGSTFFKAGCLKFVHDCFQFVGPQVLNGLIEFLRDPAQSFWVGIGLTAAVTIAQLIMSLTLRHYFFLCYRVGIRIRTALLLAIYKKSLKIDSSYYITHPIGQVTNLMSVDVQRLQDVVTYCHAIWYSFLQIGLALFFLWRQLGPSCLAGVIIIIGSIPLTACSAKWMGALQKKLMVLKDDRMQANQEVLGNMRVVKLQAWEGPYGDKISHLRELELRQLFRYLLGNACTWLLWSAVPLLIALSTFAAYIVIAGKVLDVASALTALALFEILRFPLFMLPMVINMLVEATVSANRIRDFLAAPDHVPPRKLEQSESTKMVQLVNATFTYQTILPLPSGKKKNLPINAKLDLAEKELLLVKAKLMDAEEHLAQLEGRPHSHYGSTSSDSAEKKASEDAAGRLLCLRRVNFECNEGEFIAVVGAVGSGKSTFLKSILGEVQCVSGDFAVRGKVAYFDQKPFIMNDTVKGNILFGKPDDSEDLYQLAIKSSSLEHDLTMLPGGDQCEIGEKGITLSGGQKARIGMARVVYHNADISLLDDCLSAVDAHVGRDLFNECIVKILHRNEGNVSGSRGKKRTVILVTNALQYLSHSSVDRNGVVVETGSYKELSGKNSQFKSYLNAFNESMAGEYDDEPDKAEGTGNHLSNDMSFSELLSLQTEKRRISSVGKKRISSADMPADDNKNRILMTDEMAEREVGKLSKDVYLLWAQAAGGIWVTVPCLMLLFTLGEAVKIAANWWLTHWSHSASPDSASQMHYLTIYGLIIGCATLTDFGRICTVVLLSLKASKTLFASILQCTLNAPMSFFDTTPTGRIMNRFSKDIYTLDESLPASFRTYASCCFMVLSTLVVVTFVTPAFSIMLVPVLYFYRKQQMYFSQCYRELKRFDSVARSPIYALFGETLDGPCTIRAFAAEPSLFERMIGLVDRQQHAFFLNQSGLSWLAVRLELIGTTIIFSACMAVVWQKRLFPVGNEAFAGLAGLSISYALTVTQYLNGAVRFGSDFEANMVSVERLRQYTHLSAEAARATDIDKTLSPNWPAKGKIEFKNVTLRYRPDLPLVLKGLNLTIPPQSKVGIVGRTGAGKSTLMAAMMRLVEVDGGTIFVDGVDTKTLGLRRLRSSIAVIPQDPVLFSGTVKSNLDPFDQYKSEQLIDVLERVGLWSSDFPSAIKTLNETVQQDGSNFSVGQRQLLIIARALLDGAKIVICDEATAAIDAEADSRIQKVLRTDFAKATTLTVAHRLNTIMDSTHILVMSDGKAAEFDSPANLLSKGGLFRDLVDKWGEEQEG